MSSDYLARIKVNLGLDTAEFTDGITKAQASAEKFGKVVGVSLTASVVGIVAAAGAAYIALDKLTNQTAGFQRLAEKTGASAEGLASFAIAARSSDTSMEEVAKISIQLTKNLAGVEDTSKGAGRAVAALGLNLKDFKALSAEDRISALSKALAGFRDDSGKTSVALALLGKSGAEALPFLKELEAQGGRQIILTQKQIETANDYANKQARLTAEIDIYAQAIAARVLPALVDFKQALTDSVLEVLNMGKTATDLKNNKGIEEFASAATEALAEAVDMAYDLGRAALAIGSSFGVVKEDIKTLFKAGSVGVQSFLPTVSNDEWNKANNELQDQIAKREKILKEANARYAALGNGLGAADRVRANQNKRTLSNGAFGALAPDVPKLPSTGTVSASGDGGASDANATRKKLLANALKDFERQVSQEREILASRNKFADLYNAENILSFDQYYTARRVSQEENVSATIAIYDKEIAALKAYQAQSKKASEREEATGKINDLLEKKAKLQRTAGEDAIILDMQEAKSKRDLEKSIREVSAALLELEGNSAAAAKIRLGDQYKDLRATLEANGRTGDVVNLDKLIAGKTALADFNQYLEKQREITGTLQNAEDRLFVTRQTGAISELGMLSQVSEERKKAVIQGEAVVKNLEDIAKASQNPQLIVQAEAARNALEKLKTESDLVAQKFETIFKDASATAFSDWISGTKSAGDAFKSFTDSVVQQISRIASQTLMDALFSSGGSSGSGGSGGGFGGLIGTFFSGLFGGGKAVGGAVNPGMLYRVNENKPEVLDMGGEQFLMMGNKRGTVNPNPNISGGNSNIYNISMNVPAQTTRTTGTQLAADFQRKISIGNRNR